MHLFQDLTDRQIGVLVPAYEHGLFDGPAQSRMTTIARREGLSRSTFGEHLRKGIAQPVRNACPRLKLRDAKGAPLQRPRASRHGGVEPRLEALREDAGVPHPKRFGSGSRDAAGSQGPTPGSR